MHNRSNALLVELLIVIMFFMLSSTILLEVFGKAHGMSEKAEAMADAVVEAQNTADLLYLSDAPEETLLEAGFAKEEDSWTRSVGTYLLEVTLHSEESETGIIHYSQVAAVLGDETLVTLPVARYEEGMGT